MRSFLFFVSGACACEVAYYKNPDCSEAVSEFEVDMGGATTKVTFEGTMAWIPGQCLTLGTPFKSTVESSAAGTTVKEETEVPCTYGLAGHGYGPASTLTYGKDVKECEFDRKAYQDATTNDARNAVNRDFDEMIANQCQALSTESQTGYSLRNKDPKGLPYRYVACGPVPGAVWGIVLSSLGLVLSFAGLGLAAAAGK